MMTLSSLVPVFFSTVLASAEAPATEGPTEPEATAHNDAQGGLLDPEVPILDAPAVRRINQKFTGIGVGYDNGYWGGGYGQTVKVSVPFGRKLGRYMGLRLRSGVMHHNDDVTNQYDPVVNVGGELFGRGPVWSGLVRVYGGGGLWAGIRPNPTDEGKDVALGYGGHFGVEFMAAPFMSFTFELGGQAPGHDLGHDAGASAMGGVMFYFGRTEK